MPESSTRTLGDGYLAPLVEAIEPRGRIVSFGTSAGAEVTFNLQTVTARWRRCSDTAAAN